MKKESVVSCPFCSLSCQFKIRRGEEEVVYSQRTRDELEFFPEAPVNRGSLCPRGHFSYELLAHPYRLGQAFWRSNGRMHPELPERIFQTIARELRKKSQAPPAAILFHPDLSLHDLTALQDFARQFQLPVFDFVAPADQHFFRGLMETPFRFHSLDNVKQIRNLRHLICLGDIFTKHPVLSQHLLEAKYAFRGNRSYSLQPFACRTTWFSNLHLSHQPHLEPLLLLYLLHLVSQEKKGPDALAWLQEKMASRLVKETTALLTPEQRSGLEAFARLLTDEQEAALIFSTHLYNAAGGYLNAFLLSALSELTGKYFLPLFTSGNLYFFLQNRQNPEEFLPAGRAPNLYHLQQHPPRYLIAAGFNPGTLFPGQIAWPESSQWLLFSTVQTDLPLNTVALLPITHFHEQLDWRLNFLGESLSADPAQKPLGASQPLSQLLFLFAQALAEPEPPEAGTFPAAETGSDWQQAFLAEWEFYLEKLRQLQSQSGAWLIPQEHVAHHEDGALTRYSSWAEKDCQNNRLVLSANLARHLSLSENQPVVLPGVEGQEFQVAVEKSQCDDRFIGYAHYPPIRRSLKGEFAKHNHHYYFWCPRIEV